MSGRLAAVYVNTPNTITNIYTTPATKTSVVTLSVCNMDTQSIQFSVMFRASDTATVGQGEFIEYNFELAPGNTYERSGLVIFNPQTIAIQSTGLASAVIWGYEE